MSFKEIVKSLLKSCGIGRLFYPFVHRIYRSFAIPRRRKLLQQKGCDVLRILNEKLVNAGITYFIDFGTLLGVIRDNGFIKYDDDIDIGICRADIDRRKVLSLLLANGFKFVHAFVFKGSIIEFTVSYQNLPVDVFFREYQSDRSGYWVHSVYFDPSVRYSSTSENSCRRRAYPLIDEVREFVFKGVKVSIPVDPESLLAFEFGNNWRTPIKDCKSASDAIYEELSERALRVIDVTELIQ